MTAPTTAAKSHGDFGSSVVMERRQFGSTDLRVSPVGLGCARIGGVFQGESGAFLSLLSAAADSGINFFDTADMYSSGESESILGRAFKRRRDDVIIASKIGYVLPAQRRLAGRIKPLLRPMIRFLRLNRAKLPAAVRGAPSQNFSPDYIRRAVEASLGRLGTDHIDLIQLHSPSGDVIRRGDWSQALEDLRKEGKVRYYGVACDGVSDALAALDCPGVSSIQMTLNLFERKAAETLIPAARARGVAVIARECLSNGLLAKEPNEIDPARMYRDDEERSRRERQLEHYRAVARDHGVPLPALALKYAMAEEGVSTALVGVRTRQQLDGVLRWFTTKNVASSAFAPFS